MAGLYQNQGLTAAPPALSVDFNVWAVSRRKAALAEAANASLRKWAQNGTLNAILRRWVLP